MKQHEISQRKREREGSKIVFDSVSKETKRKKKCKEETKEEKTECGSEVLCEFTLNNFYSKGKRKEVISVAAIVGSIFILSDPQISFFSSFFSVLIRGIMIYLGNKKFPFVAVCKIIFMTAKSKRYVIPFVLFIVFFAIRYNIENACYVEFWHIEQSIYIDCNF